MHLLISQRDKRRDAQIFQVFDGITVLLAVTRDVRSKQKHKDFDLLGILAVSVNASALIWELRQLSAASSTEPFADAHPRRWNSGFQRCCPRLGPGPSPGPPGSLQAPAWRR